MAQPSAPTSEPRAAPSEGPDARTVLVADDDRSVREALGELVALTGCRVVEAEDGEQALLALRSEKVGVLILDLRMPRRDGWSVLQELGGPPPLVIVHSAVATGAAVPAGKAFGEVFATLSKPTPAAMLLQVLREALAGLGS